VALRKFEIPAGTRLFIGTPAHPMDPQLSAAIASITSSIDGIAEAHLPQMYALGAMEQPAQVLVLVPQPGANLDQVLIDLSKGLDAIQKGHVDLDIWPINASNPILDSVRSAGCQLSPTDASPTS
jgi:hypothetical protein